MKKKRGLSFAVAAILCCVVLFAVGIGFGYRATPPQDVQVNPENKVPLIDRIHVIAPKFGHAPVRPESIASAKEIIQNLPRPIYDLLDRGGASVNLSPNIEDNWPGSGDGIKPGTIDTTMGEEGGRCYGRDAWIYESKKIRGSQKLLPPRSQEVIRSILYQILGHSINDCMGVMSKRDEYIKVYDEDVSDMTAATKERNEEETQGTDESRAMGCSMIIAALIGGEEYNYMVRSFPRTAAYLKKELKID